MLIYDSLEPCERILHTFTTINKIPRLIYETVMKVIYILITETMFCYPIVCVLIHILFTYAKKNSVVVRDTCA